MKTLAVLWLLVLTIGVVVLNGIICYNLPEVRWFELSLAAVIASFYLTVMAIETLLK